MPTYNVTGYVTNAAQATCDSISSSSIAGGQPNNAYILAGRITSSDSQVTYWTFGVRFPGVKIPKGATITSATFNITVSEYSTSAVGSAVKGHLWGITGGDDVPLSYPAAKPSTKPKTTNYSIVEASMPYERVSVDIKAVLQELIDQPSWNDTSVIGFVCGTNSTISPTDAFAEFNSYWSGFAQSDVPHIIVTYEYTPTLQTLTTSFNKVSTSRPNGFEFAAISGFSEGSTKTVTTNTSGGRIDFNTTTNQLYVSSSLSGEGGKSYTIAITETLAGAIGSPKTTTFVIDVEDAIVGVPPTFISFGPAISGGSTTWNVPTNQAGDLMIAYTYSLNFSTAYPNVSIPGWTKATPTVNTLYAGMYGMSYDVFYRTSTGSEPSTYSIVTDGGVNTVEGFVVRNAGNLIISSTSGPAPTISWNTLLVADNTFVALVGGTPMGSSAEAWDTVIPTGTTSPPKTERTGYSMAYYTHASGSMAVKSAPVMGDFVAFTVAIEPAGPPTLSSLSVAPSSIAAETPADTVVGAILGSKVGSTLETVGSSLFKVVGTNLVTSTTLTTPGTYAVTIKETLVGATNSPRETTVNITITEAPPIQFIATGSGSTTPSIPAHQAGDLLVIWMFRDGSTTAPALPAGFTTLITGSGNTTSFRVAYRIATASGTSGGGATTATTCITHVYRPKTNYTLSVGASAQATGASTTVSYPALTLQDTSGLSWVGAFSGHRSTNTTLETPPAGMITRSSVADATDEAAGFDTNKGVTSWSAQTVSVWGTSSGWISATYEIKATLSATPSTRDYVRYGAWVTQ